MYKYIFTLHNIWDQFFLVKHVTMHSFLGHNFILTSFWKRRVADCPSWRIHTLSIVHRVCNSTTPDEKQYFLYSLCGDINHISNFEFSFMIFVSVLLYLLLSMNSNVMNIFHHKSMFFEQYDCKTKQEWLICVTSAILQLLREYRY